jgi:two-component system NtrC family sensor kinase
MTREEEALRASEARFRAVVEGMGEGMLLTDLSDVILYCNARMAQMSGYTVEEMRGRAAYELLLPQEAWPTLQARNRHRANGTSERYETPLLRKDGNTWWAEVHATPLYDPDGVSVVGTIGCLADITPRKQAEAERERLAALLLQNEKRVALGELVAGVAHEINNPLAAASALAQLLENHPAVEVQADAQTIHRMLKRIERIVRSLRCFAASNDHPQREEVRVETILEEALHLVGPTLRQAWIRVEQDIATDLPTVRASAGQIEQVLVNLLVNAEQALRPKAAGERCLRIHARRDASHPLQPAPSILGWVVIEIEDTGVGIPPEIHGRLFDPFFTTKPVGEGTGLGLSICQGIVQAHGGSLTFQSRVGKGTIFTLALPVE